MIECQELAHPVRKALLGRDIGRDAEKEDPGPGLANEEGEVLHPPARSSSLSSMRGMRMQAVRMSAARKSAANNRQRQSRRAMNGGFRSVRFWRHGGL